MIAQPLYQPLYRPQAFSLDNIWLSNDTNIDPDVAGYINAISATGATVTATQQSAINAFITTGKTEGWYSLIKRFYLPIWQVAGANAICMVSLTNLTFNGGITHGAGFIQGDGYSGYVDTNTTPSSIGLTKDSYYCGFLRIFNSESDAFDFGINFGAGIFLYQSDWHYDSDLEQNFYYGEYMRIVGNTFINYQSPVTLLSIGGTTSSRFLKDRTSSGVVTKATDSKTNITEITNANLYLMAANFNNIPVVRTNSRYGAFFFGTAMSDAQDTAFTLALKNLWETTTGLTIP